MSNRHNKQSLVLGILSGAIVLLNSCSQTKGIPENEYLYTGIKELAYGHKWGEKPEKKDNNTGIITAVANAYTAVEDVLSGKVPTTSLLSESELTKEQQDSLKGVLRQEEAASATARAEVSGVLSYAPDGSIMGSSKWKHPFTPSLWIWNQYANSHTWFGKWMFNSFATSPVLVSTVSPRIRCQVARNTLSNFGYFHSDVKYRIEDTKNPRKKKISYQILPGELFRFGNIEYSGFKGTADSLVKNSMSERLLFEGEPFSVQTLGKERDRLSMLFRNNGYYFYRTDYIKYKADTLQKPLTAMIKVQPSPSIPTFAKHPYHIGNTYITIYKYNNTELTDSFSFRSISMRWSGGKIKRPPLRLSAMLKHLYTRKGEVYSQDTHNLALDKIAAMGIFSSVQMNFVPRDTSVYINPLTGREQLRNDTLDVHLTTMLDKPYNSEFEAKVTNKTNGQVGPGLAYSINKKNAFRGAETLTFGVNGSYEWQTGANVKGNSSAINSWKLGANLDLVYPRFMLFGIGRKLNRHMLCSTTFKLDGQWLNRAGYYGSVTAGIRAKWTFRQNDNIVHEFTPFHVEFNNLLSHTQKFDSIMSMNPAIAESFKDKLVPSMEYAFTWTSPASKIHKSRISFFTKQALQFQKYTFEFAHNRQLTERSNLVLRTYLGFLWNYGNNSAPYADLFYVGGANSIRAFSVRSIGPGSFHPEKSSYSYLNQVGDTKFEFNIEYRFPIVSNLFGAAFIDTGNVWLVKDDPARPEGTFQWKNLGKELAVGTGVGLRYDLEFLVIRFDLGIGVHSPYDTGKSGYYNMPSFGKSLGYHLAIGYPF